MQEPLSSSTDVFRRMSLGLGSQAYGQVVQVIVRLAEVPLLFHFWGARLYGEWLMLAAIPAYLAISDVGFATAAVRDMSMRSGAGDQRGALTVFQSTAILLTGLSVVVLAAVTALAMIAPLGSWFGFHEIAAGPLKFVLVLLVTQVLITLQGGLLYGGFWCSGDYSVGMGLLSTTQLLEFLALAVAVSLGGGPVAAAEAYLGARILGTFFMRLALRRTTPWLHYGLGHISLGEIKRLAAPAFASMAFPLGNALNIQAMRLIVGVVLGPAAVAAFAPLRTLSNLVAQPRGIINRLIEPELSMAFGRGDQAMFARLFLRSCQAALWLCLLVATILLLLGLWIWPLWTVGAVPMHWRLFLCILAATVVNSLWFTALMVPYATNRHTRIAVVYITVYGAGALSLGYFGAANMGLFGVGIAVLAAEIVMALYVLPVSLELAGQGGAAWFATILQPPVFLFSTVMTRLRSEGVDRGVTADKSVSPRNNASTAVRRPQFFLLGGPKCGTTSLAAYLSTHPDILISNPKEPNYFCKDLQVNEDRAISDHDYLAKYFPKLQDTSVRAALDASVWYLYSEIAVSEILKFQPTARFLVMLRNPVDMAYSLHSLLQFMRQEDVFSFAAAWNLQGERKQGRHLPKNRWLDARCLQYKAVASLGTQLERLFKEVDKSRVHIELQDDLATNPFGVYQRVLSFMGVRDDGRSSFPKMNSARKLNSRMLVKILRSRTAEYAADTVKSAFDLRSLGVGRVELPMRMEDRVMLVKAFSKEISKLETLLKRDLSHWRYGALLKTAALTNR